MYKNTKTPVMVLQELTVKKGYDPPNYELVYSEQGTHINTFHYQVCVQHQHAIGIGRSKKEAKHDAAKKVLELLSENGIIAPDESKDLQDIRVEGNSPKTPSNCIPTLSELCVENKITPPEFVEISAVGLAHCREFTYECRIGSITTRATAGSKKHAKQFAAMDMLERITNVLPQLKEQYDVKQLQLTSADEEAIEHYNNLKVTPLQINLNAKPTNSENQFVEMMEERGISKEEVLRYFKLPRNEDTLSNLLQLFECKFSTDVLEDTPPLVTVSVNSDTPLTTMGIGNGTQEAYTNALQQMFTVLETFISLDIKN